MHHRRVVGKPHFFEPYFDALEHIFFRLANGMAAKRRMHVIIGR